MNKTFAFGDSVMKGVVYDGTSYRITKDSFASLWSRSHSRPLTNYAKMGHTVIDGMEVYKKRSGQISEGDTVLLEYGGNDCDFDWESIGHEPHLTHKPKTSIKDFTSTYIAMIKDIQSSGARPIMFSLPPLDSMRYFRHLSQNMTETCRNNVLDYLKGSVEYISHWHEQYNLAIFKIARTMSVPLVDITSCILSRLNYCDFICLDGIHPNERGHELIAQELEY